ncbi:MAG: hypothetical protein B7Y39_02990 [Bdellovibrio sp. 28-41-41]|nr:MAG: hypothetical protein B7Y39_02990 [Bdellovibrio sp. 28-41-41]
MKTMLVSLFFTLVSIANPISGLISVDKGAAKEIKSGGTLFIFAKNAGGKAGDGQMPVAVQRIADPKFPVKFELGPENAMVQGTPFIGPFTVYARYSQVGNATDKSGPEGATADGKKIKPGDKDLKIELKKK